MGFLRQRIRSKADAQDRAQEVSLRFVERDEGPLDARESAALVAWYQASPINVEQFLGVATIARYLRAAGGRS